MCHGGQLKQITNHPGDGCRQGNTYQAEANPRAQTFNLNAGQGYSQGNQLGALGFMTA